MNALLTKAAAALLIATNTNPSAIVVNGLDVGEEVCYTGYIMDQYCIGLGHFLDMPDSVTLAEPENHSFHCLLDVSFCQDSGYVVLADKDPSTGMHCIGARLEDTQAILDAGFAAGSATADNGYCSGCTNEDPNAPTKGFYVTIKGTVKDLGDGSTDSTNGAPLLENIQVLDESVGCGDTEPSDLDPVCLTKSTSEPADDEPETTPDDEAPPADTTSGSDSLSCPDTLDQSREITSGSTIYYAVVPDSPEGAGNGILCGRLEVVNDGWIGLGFSPSGTMADSQAVIGVPESGTVEKYELRQYGATVMAADKQTLRDTSVSEEDGKTVVTFTKLLVEDGETPIKIDGSDNNFLSAYGGDTVGYHTSRTPFTIAFGASSDDDAPSTDIKVGDEVCISNYLMDNYCIDLGHFLDMPDSVTLAEPENHSFHCLLDVPFCQDSGYVVLADKDPATGMHCIGYRLEDTQAILDAGFATGSATADNGYCTGCTNEDSDAPTSGFQATIKGTVKELGDGSDSVSGAPLLENIEVLDASVGCETTIVNPVCMPAPPAPEEDIKVGDEVCITNYLMDNYCIGLGHFLDMPDSVTLAEPENHSFHCLLDVSFCQDSGYVVLADKDPSTGMHCIGYRLEDTQAILDAGFAAGSATADNGYCSGCTNEDPNAPTSGFMATIKGTVKELGDGSDTTAGAPLLENIQVLDSSVGCETTIVNPVCLPGPSDVVPPATEGPTQDCTKEFCEEQLDPDFLLRYRINVPDGSDAEVCDGCTISMETIYTGEGWVAIGFSTNGQMIGSEAVIGVSPGEEPLKYNLASTAVSGVAPMPESQQTLTDASVVFEDANTIMKFTKIMKEPGEIEITTGDNTFLWAYGSSYQLAYHGANRAPFNLNLSSGASEAVAIPYMSAWLAHGIMAFLAWGVLVPFAVQSSLLRSLLPEGPLWFNLHRAFNTTAFALFIAAFAVAVSTVIKEKGEHFSNDHEKMGLAMFIVAFVQVFGGITRPHTPEPGEEKTSLRKGWEVGHRVIGVALLACGFWQMQEGIKLYAIKYSVNEDPVTIAYWVWVGLMSAIIVFGGVYYKIVKKSPEREPADVPAAEDIPIAEDTPVAIEIGDSKNVSAA